MPIAVGLALSAMLAAGAGDLRITSESEATAVAFSSSGALAALCRDGKIRLWRLPQGQQIQTWERGPHDAALVFVGVAGWFAAIGADGRIRLRNLDDGALLREYAAGEPRVSALTASHKSGLLAGASRNPNNRSENVIRIWGGDGRLRFEFPAGLGGVSAMTFSAEGDLLAAAAYDTEIRIWDTRQGELSDRISELTVSAFDLKFSPNGRFLAAAGVDRVVYVWDLASRKRVQALAGQPEMISALAFSPDGRLLVTGGMNEMAFNAPVKVILWDVATAKPLRTMEAGRRVAAAAFSPDGKWVAIASRENTIPVWSVPHSPSR